jgi:hypothetical protein
MTKRENGKGVRKWEGDKDRKGVKDWKISMSHALSML